MDTYLIERTECPLCCSPQFNILCDIPYTTPALRTYLTDFYENQGMIEYDYLEGENFTLLRCKDCSFIYQKMVPSPFLAERIYEHWISPQAAYEIEVRKKNLKEYWNFANDFIRILVRLKKHPAEVRVFDFGMGWGTTLEILKSMGCQVYGNEIAQSRIDYVEKNGIINLTREEFAQMTFDYIHAFQVLEHINDPKSVVSFLSERLAVGGLLRLGVPYGAGMENFAPHITWEEEGLARERRIAVDPLEHINCFTYQTLRKLGEDCGLEPVRLKMPFMYQNIYQLLRGTLRRPYRLVKFHQTARLPDIVFQKRIDKHDSGT